MDGARLAASSKPNRETVRLLYELTRSALIFPGSSPSANLLKTLKKPHNPRVRY
jgi:hypothetical protein